MEAWSCRLAVGKSSVKAPILIDFSCQLELQDVRLRVKRLMGFSGRVTLCHCAAICVTWGFVIMMVIVVFL